MNNGKKICDILKGIRMEVAQSNGIPYTPVECTHEGDCAGTCPRCEEEVRYLERQLDLRRAFTKAAVVIGVSVGMAAMVESCGHPFLAGMIERPPSEIDSTATKGNTVGSTTETPADTTVVDLQ